MLGSADPEHTWLQRLISCLVRTDDGYECKSWATAYVKFYLNSTYVLMIVDISLYAEWLKINLNSCVTANLAWF